MTTPTTLEAIQIRHASTAAPAVTADGHTWDDLTRDHWSRLVGYARRKGCSDPEAVAGDVLADAFAARDRFTGTSRDFGKWLYTIAFRRISDTQRRWYASPEVLTDSPADTVVSPVVASPDVVYDDRESAISAFAALDILSERDRRIIEARVIDEQPVKAVAERLGLSQGAVRVYQSRALNKLRAHLDRLPSLGGGLLVFRWPFARRSSRFADWLSEAAAAGRFTAGTQAAAGGTVAATMSTAATAALGVALAVTAVTAAPVPPGGETHPAPSLQVDAIGTPSTFSPPVALDSDSRIDDGDIALAGAVAIPETSPVVLPERLPGNVLATGENWAEFPGASILDETTERTKGVLERTTSVTGSVTADVATTAPTDPVDAVITGTDASGEGDDDHSTTDSANEPTPESQLTDGMVVPILEVTAID